MSRKGVTRRGWVGLPGGWTEAIGLEFVVAGGGLGAGVDVEFFVDATAVSVHGVVADAEFVCDFLAEVALGEEVEDFFFAFGKLAEFVFGIGRAGLAEALDDFSGDAAAHGGAALVDLTEGGEELFAGGVFEKVSGGAGFEGFEDAVGVFVDRDHNELDLRQFVFEAANAFDAVEAREVDVGEDDVGFVDGDSFVCFLSVVILADEGEAIGLFDPPGVDGSQRDVIFDDGDSDVVSGGSHGRTVEQI